jgi:hypothetical protein
MENIPKNKMVNDPKTVYKTTSNINNTEELHPVLVQLLEKTIQECDEGKGATTVEVMKRVSKKYPFLK